MLIRLRDRNEGMFIEGGRRDDNCGRGLDKTSYGARVELETKS